MRSAFYRLIFMHCLTIVLSAQTIAPNAPGADAQWESAGKQGVGTANSLNSKIWFTLQGGVLTEVFYPTADMANVQNLQLVIFDPETRKVETERDDATHRIQILNNHSLSFRQTNTAKSGKWKITKDYVTDPQNNSILVKINYTGLSSNELYLYYDPSLNNSGMQDTAWTDGKAFLAAEGDKTSALICSRCELDEMTNGFLDTNDGISQLKKNGKIINQFARAEKGNVVQTARLSSSFSDKLSKANSRSFELVLSFGRNSSEALKTAQNSAVRGFQKIRLEYEKGWGDYVKTLPKTRAKYQAQLNVAAMVLKAHEDKTFRGGQIASLSKPWIYGAAANDPYVGGYHLVWARDLYQVSTAYMALGDNEAAKRALNYLFKVQQREDGSFPQITWLDGRIIGDAIQMDEVSYPLILAYQLGQNDPETYTKHIKRSADYIVKNGPKTQQERWEEKPGYSPATIAAEIAALVCSAEIARKNADEISAKTYLATADDWAANVEKWTATTNGMYADGKYYLRLTQNGKPDAGEKIELNNNGGIADEREIVDAGFLELVRLGIKSPNDPLIVKSIAVIDQVLKVKTPNGEGFYRYFRDGYGEMPDGRPWNWDGKYTGKGHLWVLLTGERGQYELARGEFGKARLRLDAMRGFANEALMLPEQVWDKSQNTNPNLVFGEGAGSATPLAWSMAQFIRLAVNLRANKNLETPEVVYTRYVKSRHAKRAANFSRMNKKAVLLVKERERVGFNRRAKFRIESNKLYSGKTK
jgi:glucoamylase